MFLGRAMKKEKSLYNVCDNYYQLSKVFCQNVKKVFKFRNNKNSEFISFKTRNESIVSSEKNECF